MNTTALGYPEPKESKELKAWTQAYGRGPPWLLTCAEHPIGRTNGWFKVECGINLSSTAVLEHTDTRPVLEAGGSLQQPIHHTGPTGACTGFRSLCSPPSLAASTSILLYSQLLPILTPSAELLISAQESDWFINSSSLNPLRLVR